jgi:peptidoglycan-associated lipoprotein
VVGRRPDRHRRPPRPPSAGRLASAPKCNAGRRGARGRGGTAVEIRPHDAKVLDENARWLKAHPNARLLIEGHADDRGTNEYNLALGDRRAKATRDHLISLGVAGARITVITYGEERPLCSEDTEACWAQNRRAQFLAKEE